MRYAFSLLTIGLCVLIANPCSATDISAAKKKKRQYVHAHSVPPVYARRGWMDPSLGPDGRPYPNPYPPGTCSTDMGYGRFSTCEFHE
jgi:hypothetical protein